MIATAPAPSTPPPSVPFSRVDSGWPLHPASAKAAISAIAAAGAKALFEIAPCLIRPRMENASSIRPRRALLRFLLLLQLLDLLFEFLLLLLNLALRLRLLSLVVLHRVTDGETADAAECAADCRARSGCADRSADNRASCRADAAAEECSLFTGRQWLPGASSHDQDRGHRHENL